MKQVYIDGSAGTTGLQIVERLSAREDIELNILPESLRKDTEARREAINRADIVFLCLPDQAAKEAVAMCENPQVVIIDTSTAHRTSPGWVYGFPELGTGQEILSAAPALAEDWQVDVTALEQTSGVQPGERMRQVLRRARRIANPGCHASGFIALVSPLMQTGILDRSALLSCFSLTGYSGGGKQMIAAYESPADEGAYASPRQYGLSQEHKHLPEMTALTGLKHAPAFCPVVADFKQGMEVTVPLFAGQLAPDAQTVADKLGLAYGAGLVELISTIYAKAYSGPVVHFARSADEDGFMAADKMAGRDDMEITVTGNDERALLIARFDNLGKGACGAAIQNMNLVLSIDETTGLNLGAASGEGDM